MRTRGSPPPGGLMGKRTHKFFKGHRQPLESAEERCKNQEEVGKVLEKSFKKYLCTQIPEVVVVAVVISLIMIIIIN